MNGDTDFHQSFHAIGSGGSTAYAVYRTLGGPNLTTLDESKALLALLRIIRTAIYIDVAGVGEPVSVFVIKAGKVRRLSEPEVDANMELINRWCEKEQERFLNDEV